MITSSVWVPRGYATPFPTKQEFDEEEFERISALAKLQLDDAKEDLEEAKAKESNGNGTETGTGTGSGDGKSDVKAEPQKYSFLPPAFYNVSG